MIMSRNGLFVYGNRSLVRQYLCVMMPESFWTLVIGCFFICNLPTAGQQNHVILPRLSVMTILHRAQKINTISERAQENYIWHERQITLTAHNDKYAKSKDLTYEVVQIGYHKTSLVIANNGRAVSYKKLAKEKINLIRKLQRFNASPQKMAANHAKQLRREHIFNHALMTAFYFRLLSPQHLRIPTQKCW